MAQGNIDDALALFKFYSQSERANKETYRTLADLFERKAEAARQQEADDRRAQARGPGQRLAGPALHPARPDLRQLRQGPARTQGSLLLLDRAGRGEETLGKHPSVVRRRLLHPEDALAAWNATRRTWTCSTGRPIWPSWPRSLSRAGPGWSLVAFHGQGASLLYAIIHVEPQVYAFPAFPHLGRLDGVVVAVLAVQMFSLSFLFLTHRMDQPPPRGRLPLRL